MVSLTLIFPKTGTQTYMLACRPVGRVGDELYAKIPPSELHEYRNTHHFRGPCCLCPYDNLILQHAHVEAAICLDNGIVKAMCAAGSCSYEG